MFKKISTIAALSVVVLASCGGTKTVYVTQTLPPETDAPTTSTMVVQTLPPAMTTEDQFVEAIYGVYNGGIYVSDDVLIGIGYAMCDHFRSGGNTWTASEIIVSALPYNTEAQILATAITAAAVIYFCPDQSYKMSDA